MHQATPTSWMMLNREISGWQERALKAEAECDRLRLMSKDCANRTAVTSLAFLAKIVRDIGYENKRQESNAEMIGRALRNLEDKAGHCPGCDGDHL